MVVYIFNSGIYSDLLRKYTVKLPYLNGFACDLFP